MSSGEGVESKIDHLIPLDQISLVEVDSFTCYGIVRPSAV